jgi:hypothetical protein
MPAGVVRALNAYQWGMPSRQVSCYTYQRYLNRGWQEAYPNFLFHSYSDPSIKEEALDQIMMFGERFLHHVLRQYLAHYHTERNHQGLGNQFIAPEAERSRQGDAVVRRDRLGGLLSYYVRDAA